MDENQNQTQPTTPEQPMTAPESAPMADAAPAPEPQAEPKKDSSFGTLVVIGAVVVALGAIAMLMFGGDDAAPANGIDPTQVVATVNGEDIVGADLTTSISQITATAQIQGIDITTPTAQAEIQGQAVELLINTALLEQEAVARGITVTDEEVDARIAALIAEIGSEELLEERMAGLGIDDDALAADVKSELMIQALLDQAFAAENITVTEAEINSLYESSTAGDDAAPALAEVRPQVEAQLRAAKEQEIVDALISSLREGAAIEIN